MHPIFKSVYTKKPSIDFKTDFTDKPAVKSSENKRYSRRSMLLQSNQPYVNQNIPFDKIKEIYKATLPKPQQDMLEVIITINESLFN